MATNLNPPSWISGFNFQKLQKSAEIELRVIKTNTRTLSWVETHKNYEKKSDFFLILRRDFLFSEKIACQKLVAM